MGFKEELSAFTHAKILFNEPMKKHTGYGVGGKASFYAEADSLFSVSELLNLANRYRVPYKVIGNGTNILVSDNGYDGLIINTRRLNDVFFKKDQVRAMAGASLEKLLKFGAEHKLTGLESLTGIPATVGGAVVMNAGAFGHTISDNLTSVEVLSNGKIVKYNKEECSFGYRSSRFQSKKDVVISAIFNLKEGEKELIYASMEMYRELRKSMHPNGKSCGSVFKNLTGNPAGMLIEGCGLKGYTVGGAKVSEKHANFIIAERGATASDVYKLTRIIKDTVKNNFKLDLKEEIEFIGEF